MSIHKELQPETIDQSSQTESLVDSQSGEEFSPTSHEPLTKNQHPKRLKKITRKTMKTTKKPYSRYRLNKTWISF